MYYDNVTRTFDCNPTLTDLQVLDFCRNGYIVLDGVVPAEINRLTCDYLTNKIPSNPSYIPDHLKTQDLDLMRNSVEPNTILLEDWFEKHVLLNPQLAGVMRSLLGKNTGLPIIISHHGQKTPAQGQPWHNDADCVFGPELNYLEAFYYPQDTPVELGPTEIVPGSHIGPTQKDDSEPGLVTSASAGSFVIHHQSILHRRSTSTAKGLRHMLKFDYWRTVPPERDWVSEQEFDPHNAYYGGHHESIFVAHMYYWLCGKGAKFRVLGGQAWPWYKEGAIGASYGFEPTEGYVPDWKRTSPDGYSYPD